MNFETRKPGSGPNEAAKRLLEEAPYVPGKGGFIGPAKPNPDAVEYVFGPESIMTAEVAKRIASSKLPGFLVSELVPHV